MGADRACAGTVTARRTTLRKLYRAGFRPAAGGVWQRRLGRITITICTRPTATPRWLSRPLGRTVQARTGPRRGARSREHSISSISFPRTLNGRLSIDLPDGLGTSGWQMLDVPPAPIIRHHGGARYAADDYDVLYEAGYGRVKESILVHRRQGTRTWAWKLNWSKGSRPYVDGAGRVVFGGKVTLDRPVVLAANGRTVMRPRWKVRRNVVSFTVNDRRLALPYVVDPTADFPQRIHPDKVAGTRINGAEDIRPTSTTPASSCTKLPIDATGEAIFGSMIARRESPGGTIATATPSGGPNGWALQDGSSFPDGRKIFGIDSPTDLIIVAVGEAGMAMRSTDGGCSWTRLSTGTVENLRSVSSPTADAIWIVGDNGTARRSTDAGATFTNANSTGASPELTTVDALDANVAWVGGLGRMVAVTTNGGGTWTQSGVANMGDIRGITALSSSTAWVVTDPGKMFKTTNSGGSWAYQANTGTQLYDIDSANTSTAWAVGESGIVYRTTDGANWIQLASGVATRLSWVEAVSASVIWAGGDGGTIILSTDGGTTWTPLPNAAAGSAIHDGTARSTTLAWTGDDKGRVQRYYPAGGPGSWGWVSEANGGTTLSAGPWTIGARLCRETWSAGTVDVGFRARVWKVAVNGSGAITTSTPMTPWSVASPSVSVAGGACTSATVALAPTVVSMLPTEHFYIEYGLRVYGNARADQTLALSVAHPDTYVDFSAPAVDTTPVPTNLRVASTVANGWSSDSTPTLRANLVDPDWWHHNRYQICADAACTTVVAEGTSAAGQLLGSTNDAWTSPTLPDGFYFIRTRTEEDGGETDMSAWTPIEPDTTLNRCAATDVGPCDKFGIDTAVPTAPAGVNDGTGTDIDWTGDTTSLSANWGASTDAAGINRYEYCMSTTVSGSDCTGTIVQAWTTAGTALTVTRTGLALSSNTLYYTCVRAVDNAGNTGLSTCSDGVVVDTTAPPASAAVRDGAGADEDHTASATLLEANWDAVADIAPGSGLERYDACFSTSGTGADCGTTAISPWASTGLVTATSRTVAALADGTTWFSCVRAVDNVGNVGATRCSDGNTVDLGLPTVAWTSWSENSNYLHAPGGADPDLLWYNPAAPLEAGIVATATVTAADALSGMDRVEYPDLAAGAAWGAGGTDTTVGAGDTWTHGYTFTGGGVIGDPAANNATAYDAVGNAAGAPALAFRIEPDGTGPASPPMAAMSGLQNTVTYAQSISLGSDSQAGVARWIMDVQFAPMYDGVCGAWDPWIDGSTIAGYSGTAVNGSTLNFLHYLNDPDFDLDADYFDAFCFRDRVRVFDHVQNVTTIAENGFVRFDFGVPDVAISGPPDGSSQSGTFDVTGTTDDVYPGGNGYEYVDTGSGIQEVTVTYALDDGVDADLLPDATGQACAPITTFGGPWTAHTWTCTWATGPLDDNLADGWYTISVQARDRAGNLSTIATHRYLLDNQPPVVTWHSWNDGGDPTMHAVGSVAWVNPTAPVGTYQLDARVTATDLGSGVNRIEFPGLGTGWTPATGFVNATFTDPVPAANAWTMAYAYTDPALLAAPGVQQATAYDGAGNPAPVGFEVRLDGTAPTGVGASVANTNQSSATVNVSLAGGSEGALESGLASWSLLFDVAPLVNDACGAYADAWTIVAFGAGVAPATYAHDVTATGSGCYRYRLEATDNVGNVGTSGVPTTAQRVDLVDPMVDITSPADGSVQGGTFAVGGTASDVHTGVARVALTWIGPSSTSGTICDPATLGGAYPNWTFTCDWATGPADLALGDGTYTITATSYDRAGRASAVDQISVILDNNPPFTGFHSFDTSATTYAHWAGPVGTNNQLWYNPDAPAGVHSFDVLVTASDPNGVPRVEFPGAGAGWTPGSTVATQTVAIGPADRWSQTYSFDTSVAVADPPTLTATAYDPAGNPGYVDFELTPDLAAPALGDVTYPDGFHGSTSVTVAVATGDDGTGSGIRGWQLLRSDGTLSGTSCGSWSAYSLSVATGLGAFTGDVADTVNDPGCFRYRLVVTDNVGRVGTFDDLAETMIDLTPPTGSLFLVEGTNPQYQHLLSPTQIYVNTNSFASGTFDVDVNATAASGILDVTFPVLASGFTGDGVQPGPGPDFLNTYAWTGPAGTPPAGLEVDVRSNSLGPLALPFEVIADPNAPTAIAPTHASGFTTATTVDVSWTTGTDGTGSGVASHQLERETGTLAAGACTWSGTWTAMGPIDGPATQTDSTLAHATCYRYRTTMVDNVGNVGSTIPSAPIMVDTTAPTGATITLTEGTNPARQWVSAPDTIWVAADPGVTASFSATVTATDPESGTGVAVFPALGSTFVYTSTGDYTASYAWSATATAPAVAPVVQVSNGSGLTTTIPFTVNVDADAPSGATLDQEAGFVTDFLVDLSYTTGSDGTGSGIATWRIERRSAPYDIVTDSCGAWSTWTVYPSAPGQPASPHVDSSVVQPTCYQYQLLEIDNVGNVTPTIDGDTVKVIYDVTPPEPFSLALPTNPALPAITTGAAAPSCAAVPTYPTATPTFSWTASSDTESGLSHYDVYVDGSTIDATVPAPGTSWTSPALSEGGHTLGVRALDYQLNFRNADPAFPTDVRVDTTPPTGSLAAPADGSWTGDTTPTLDWTAADTNCLARIEVYLDGGATPVAVASGAEPSWTPTTALSNGPHTWSFTAIDTVGNAVSFGPYAFGVDTAPPAAFTVTAPTAGQTVRGFVDVSWTASSDAESGLATASTYQVWVDGALRTTVGPATTSVTIGSITNGGHSVFVRAFDAVGNYTDTAPVLFTGYGVIPDPVLLSPADGAYVNAVPTLDWDWPSDGGPAPTSYDVLLGGVNVGSQLHPTTAHAIADPGDGNHTWQIVQHDPYTGTVSSDIWNFILDRTAPSNPGPLSRSGTVVSWPLPTDPAAPVASGIAYQEFWIENSAGTQTTSTLLAAATSRDYGTLPDDTYTMWVRAYDRAGNFTDSPALVVVNDSVPPTAFNLTPPPALPALPAITHGPTTAPSCETAPTYVSAMPTLEWEASSDATSGLAGYDVYIDGTMVATLGPAATSYTVATPLAGGAHSWRVVARDVFGLTRSSTPSPMNVRVDGMSPSITYGAPADGAYTSDTTPAFSWALTDDNCAARVELTVGTDVYVLSATETAYAPSVVLPEGPTTWSVRLFDSAGNIVSAGPSRTVNVDTTAPAGVTAVFPLDGGTPDEQMMTFEWSAGTDAGSGIQRYDLIVDGTPVRSNITTVTAGTFAIYAGPHTWAIRAYDAVGNSQLFSFSFDAQVVPDVTAPDPFDLLSPADAAVIPAGTALEWEPAWDFKGVTQYRVYIDGNLAGTTAGDVTSFTPSSGAGAPICTIDYDPAVSAGCITGPTYSWGTGSTTAGTGATSPHLNVATYAGWAASGAALGVGDPTVTPITDAAAGFDGDRVWTAVEYDATIPAAGADIRFEHRYLTHTIGESAYDGATVELLVDDEGDGFGNDVWEATCEFNAKAIYGTTLDCLHEIVDLNGGYTAVMGGADKDSHPLSGQHSFAGDSAGTVQTRISMLNFAGMNVRIRFRLGMDSCYVGMPADWAAYCDDPEYGAPGYHPAQWRIDDVTLADSALQPGVHTWYVVARDAAGNARQSSQTWTFDLQ